MIRGCDRFTHIGGKWTHHDASGNETGYHIGVERVHKHPEAVDRYLLEMWMAPEMSEREWKENFTECIEGQFVETLGPYPGNGEYELVRVIERVRVDEKTGNIISKEFVPLTESICDALVLTAKMNKELPAHHKMLVAQERREKEEKAKEQRQIDIIDNLSRPQWAKQPHIISPGLETKTSGGIILP